MLTGSKTAFTPVEVDQPTVEVEGEGETPLDSPMPKTPAGETAEHPSGQTTNGAKQAEEMAAQLAPLALGSSAPSQSAVDSTQPLSTRFRPPGETVPEPRIEFHAHETPRLSGANEGKSDEATSHGRSQPFDPFGVDHAELGIPAQPLFRIDQMGVDRRMLVNRKKQLRMYRYVVNVVVYSALMLIACQTGYGCRSKRAN